MASDQHCGLLNTVNPQYYKNYEISLYPGLFIYMCIPTGDSSLNNNFRSEKYVFQYLFGLMSCTLSWPIKYTFLPENFYMGNEKVKI